MVDKFFLDVCTGSEVKKSYLQKILGYFLTGDEPNGRTFYIFYGKGAKGKSAVMDLTSEIMGYYCRTTPTSIILKRAKRGEGQASDSCVRLRESARGVVRDRLSRSMRT